jgi:hypothetical protein
VAAARQRIANLLDSRDTVAIVACIESCCDNSTTEQASGEHHALVGDLRLLRQRLASVRGDDALQPLSRAARLR